MTPLFFSGTYNKMLPSYDIWRWIDNNTIIVNINDWHAWCSSSVISHNDLISAKRLSKGQNPIHENYYEHNEGESLKSRGKYNLPP